MLLLSSLGVNTGSAAALGGDSACTVIGVTPLNSAWCPAWAGHKGETSLNSARLRRLVTGAAVARPHRPGSRAGPGGAAAGAARPVQLAGRVPGHIAAGLS